MPETHLKFTRNENYWQDGLPYLDSYEIKMLAEEMTIQSAFTNREIDYIGTSSANVVAYMTSQGFENKAVDIASSWGYYCMLIASNIEGDPWSDVRVRQAVLLYGIDWDAVAFASTGGLGSAHLQMSNNGAYDYNEAIEKESVYDLEKAKSMLADAGYADGFKTEITYGTAMYDILVTALQDQLKNLGIDATVTLSSSTADLRNAGVTPGIFMLSAPGQVDPTALLNTRYNRNGLFGKLMNFSDDYEAALAKVNAAKTQDEKNAALKEVNRISYVQDCLHRVCYQSPGIVYITNDIRDSGFESRIFTPEITYRAK